MSDQWQSLEQLLKSDCEGLWRAGDGAAGDAAHDARRGTRRRAETPDTPTRAHHTKRDSGPLRASGALAGGARRAGPTVGAGGRGRGGRARR
jgi:hypothetical protein